MFLKIYEIFEAKVPLRKVQYSRPCLIVYPEFEGSVGILPISSAMNLYKSRTVHFMLEKRAPDFSKTGLVTDSYVINEDLIALETDDLIRKRGQLEGELLQRFKLWFE